MLRALFFGRIPYQKGLEIQEHICIKAKETHCNFLCLFEHPPVYTVGLREYFYSEEEENRLRGLGAEFYRVKRGGLITFHGPGQLVVYPIFNLRLLSETRGEQVGVRRFVELVEESVLHLLRDYFRLKNAGRTHDSGVWIKEIRKICAIGIQVRKRITSHGIALNCDTDLHWFDEIIPCGLPGKTATSLSKELGRSIPISDVITPLCKSFASIFGVDKLEIIRCDSAGNINHDLLSE